MVAAAEEAEGWRKLGSVWEFEVVASAVVAVAFHMLVAAVAVHRLVVVAADQDRIALPFRCNQKEPNIHCWSVAVAAEAVVLHRRQAQVELLQQAQTDRMDYRSFDSPC